MILPIYSITPFTMMDYPNKLSAILWFSGCNFKCQYCYNTELIQEKVKRIPSTKVFEFLKSRKDYLDGVVLSGGECTLHNIYDFVKKIKDIGYSVKIDTNGSNPDLMKQLLDENLIDYVALDYKSPNQIFNQVINTGVDFNLFNRTLNLLVQSNVEHEVRTTLCPNLVAENEIGKIVDNLNNIHYAKTYYIQNYRSDHFQKEYNLDLKNKIQEHILGKKLEFNISYRNF